MNEVELVEALARIMASEGLTELAVGDVRLVRPAGGASTAARPPPAAAAVADPTATVASENRADAEAREVERARRKTLTERELHERIAQDPAFHEFERTGTIRSRGG